MNREHDSRINPVGAASLLATPVCDRHFADRGGVGRGTYYWLFDKSNRELREAVAEADRLDPGWRFEDLESARALVPDQENSALHVLAARALIPATFRRAFLDAELPAPTAQLSKKERDDLAAELGQVKDALREVKKVVGMPRGRYSVKWSKDGIGTVLPHVDAVNLMTRLLGSDAILRADSGDGAGALESVRAMIYTGKSFGDEPVMISQLVRLSCSLLALGVLERILAQTELTSAELADFQHQTGRRTATPGAIDRGAGRAGNDPSVFVNGGKDGDRSG